jgi:hypothetical protein
MQTIDNFCSHLSKTTIQKLVSPSPAAQDSLTNETGINKASSDQFYRLQVDIIIHQDQARLQEATPRACPTLRTHETKTSWLQDEGARYNCCHRPSS